MVLFVAGVQKIPTSLYDAARVDGAGAVREFFAVTLPGLRNEILVAFVLTTINALRSFDIVYNTTAGGPGNETLVPSMYMYQNAFLYNRVGYAAAIATLLAIAIFVLAPRLLADRGQERVTAGRFDRIGTYVVLCVLGDRALPGPLDPVPGAAPEDRPRQRLRVPDAHRSLELRGRLDARATSRPGFKSSFIVAATVTAVSAVLSIGTGYAFGTMRFFGDRIVFPIILLGIIFPYEATVIPLYYDFQRPSALDLLNTYWALILPQIGQSVAFGTFWMRAFFRSTPRSLIEAARIDGATSFGVLWRVLLPQARPAVMTMSLARLHLHLERVPARARARLRQRVAPDRAARLCFFAGAARAGDPTKVAAAAVLVALPILLVYLFLQRHFVRGMLAGAIKE